MKQNSALIIFIYVLLLKAGSATAQTVLQPPSVDSVRVIQILQGKSLREKVIDSISLQTIAGDVILKEGLTTFSCDSAIINKSTNVLEAFGNIHINQNDSIHTYSKYLKYIGKDRMAYLKKDVKLTDKKGILYTQDLQYDLKTGIGTYTKGGKVVNGKTVLTSENGVYYAETKDVFFKNNVHLVDPKYDIISDSLQYNTQTQVVNFITQTYIKNKDGGEVSTKSGNYDLKNGKAFFSNRTIIKDSIRTSVADIIAIDDTTGIAQLEGNAVIKDSVNGYSVIGGQIFYNKKNSSFLATRKPVLIFKGEAKDSTFIAADTLFSGIERKDSIGVTTKIKTDTLKKTLIIQQDSTGQPVLENIDSIRPAMNDSMPINDSMPVVDTILRKDTVLNQPVDTVKNIPSIFNPLDQLPDSTANKTDTLVVRRESEQEKLLKDTTVKNSAADTIRYFQAFHNVRIFNDSLQSVCDSLYYSSVDSVFRLYKDPLVFSNKSQIAGDTIHLYTKNRKAERVYVFENGIIINEVKPNIMYNQIAGRTLNGYFKDGSMDYMRVKGSPAESVFYPQDKDSAFTGMNRCKGDVIDIYFVNRSVNKIKFVNDVDGIFFPIKQIPADQKTLAKFQWLDSKRPKNKFELFE